FPAQFTLIGSSDPVTAILGQQIVLPCHLSPRMSAVNLEVRWFRSEFSSVVHLYRDRKDQYEMQILEFQGRTELLKAGLLDGNVPLRILNIRRSDEGQYHCFVQDDTFYEETVLELQVAGLGSAPLISVEGHQDGGIRVVCQSAGWYPEPKVLWRDLSGRHLPPLSETTSQGDNGLFETQTAIIVKEHSNQNLSCCIRNTILNQDKESAVYIADSFFPRVNPWIVALSVILVVLFGFIGLTVYLFKMKDSTAPCLTSDTSVWRIKSFEKSEWYSTGTWVNVSCSALNALSHLLVQQTLLGAVSFTRFSLPPPHSPAVNVTLDPDTAHPQLVLSEDGKCVRRRDVWRVSDNPERFDTERWVLGCEGFTSGRHYWEVEVGDGGFWAVGVARESVSRKGWIRISPEQGIWAVQQWGDQYQALTYPATTLPLTQVPRKIRIFLDCERGQVTFFNAGNEALIFTFPPASFSGERIRPWLWVEAVSQLTLCP
ncbi:Butyrophilin subfamily 1 member A1, partial [Chelonia mydas]